MSIQSFYLSQELNRIMKLIPANFTINYWRLLKNVHNGLDVEWDQISTASLSSNPLDLCKLFAYLDEYKKITILSCYFSAKNDRGEYILPEGNLPNPYYVDLKAELEVVSEIFNKEVIKSIEYITANSNVFVPKTFRDLFHMSCFGRSKKDIELLKLIQW